MEQMFLGIFLSPGLPQILRISWGLNSKKRVWDEFSGLEVSQKFIPIKSQNFLLPGEKPYEERYSNKTTKYENLFVTKKHINVTN